MAACCVGRDGPRLRPLAKDLQGALYGRLLRRRGKKKAAIAVGHAVLIIAYHVLDRHTEYTDMGADYFDRRDEHHLTRHLVHRLEGLGYSVQLERAAA